MRGNTAHVLFIYAKDCQKFYDATANGLVYTVRGQKGIAHVAKAADVDVLSGQVRTFMEVGFTRCVRATGIASNIDLAKLKAKAALKNRKVDDVVLGANESGVSIDSYHSGQVQCLSRSQTQFAVFRFCDIRHAVQFKHALEREEEWEDSNIQFCSDP